MTAARGRAPRLPTTLAVAGVIAVTLGVRALPGLSAQTISHLTADAPYMVLGAVLAARMLARARRAEGVEEGRLWGWLAVSYAALTIAEASATAFPSAAMGVGRLTALLDGLYFASYAAWFVAIAQAPHRPAGWSAREPGFGMELAGILVLTLGLAADLVVVPWLAAPGGAVARASGAGLYAAFDVVVCARLVALVAGTSGTWRRWYATVLAAVLGMLVMDTVGAAWDLGLLPELNPTLRDLGWCLPILVLAVACDLPTPQPAAPAEAPATLEPVLDHRPPLLAEALVAYLGTFLLVHLLANASALVPAVARQPRAVTALVVVVALGTLTVLRQRALDRHVRALARALAAVQGELAERRRLDAIARLAGAVAHEFNNQLTVIMGREELLRVHGVAEGSWREDLQDLRAATDRVAGLTADLLHFGQPRPPHAVPTDLALLADEVLRAAGARSHPGLEVSLPAAGAPLLVTLDPGQARLAVLHLVRNAMEAMPAGGRLTLTIARRVSHGRDHAVLAVEDTGRGMDAPTLARIFEPFFTTKPFGRSHGLGLSVVHGTMRAHGGEVRVTSGPDRGSRFELWFPLSPVPSSPATPAPPAQA